MTVFLELLIVFVCVPMLALTIVGIVKSRTPKRKTISIISCVVASVLVLGVAGIASSLEEAEQGDEDLESQTKVTKVAATTTNPKKEYLVCSVSELVDALDANALNAKEKYEGQYVEITGRVDVIDASGRYISLYPEDDEWEFTDVQCFVENKEQKEFIKTINTGDIVTVRGKITSVGEILGYSLEIHEFVSKKSGS